MVLQAFDEKFKERKKLHTYTYIDQRLARRYNLGQEELMLESNHIVCQCACGVVAVAISVAVAVAVVVVAVVVIVIVTVIVMEIIIRKQVYTYCQRKYQRNYRRTY